MVIIRTRAIEVIIQAVSPELIGEASCAKAGATMSAHAAAAPSMVKVFCSFISVSPEPVLEGRRAGLAGADAGDRKKVEDEDLAVADAAGLGAFADGRDD